MNPYVETVNVHPDAPNEALQPPEPPFEIGQRVYLREGNNSSYGCEPVIVVGLHWHYGNWENHWWTVKVGRHSRRYGLTDESGWIMADDVVATADEINPEYRDAAV